MVPRDEDGERAARKRAKQRQIPPTVHRLSTGSGLGGGLGGGLLGGGLGGGGLGSLPSSEDLAMLAGVVPHMLQLPPSPGGHHRETDNASATTVPSSMASPRSAASSPTDDLFGSHTLQLASIGKPEPAQLLSAHASRAQRLAQNASLLTPASSPQRAIAQAAAKASRAAAAQAAAAQAAGGGDTAAAAAAAHGGAAAADGEASRRVIARMTAHMAETLGLASETGGSGGMALPPIPPVGGIDELHEAFLLLNAEHRRAGASAPYDPATAHEATHYLNTPVLAY